MYGQTVTGERMYGQTDKGVRCMFDHLRCAVGLLHSQRMLNFGRNWRRHLVSYLGEDHEGEGLP